MATVEIIERLILSATITVTKTTKTVLELVTVVIITTIGKIETAPVLMTVWKVIICKI